MTTCSSRDRKSTRLNSSHLVISYAVFCLKKKTTTSVGTGVLVQCIKEGSKLRARVVSDAYDPDYNMRFPRDIRQEGTLYVVDQVIEASGGGSYIACGKIRRLVQ